MKTAATGLAMLCLTLGPVLAAPPPAGLRVGVYECNLPPNGMPALDLEWGIIDGATYSDYEGGRGSYQFDAGTGTIKFHGGKLDGLWRRKDSGGLFRVWQDGHMTNIGCPFSAKDPTRKHW